MILRYMNSVAVLKIVIYMLVYIPTIIFDVAGFEPPSFNIGVDSDIR